MFEIISILTEGELLFKIILHKKEVYIMKFVKYVLAGVLTFGFIANPVILRAAQTSEELKNACTQAEFDAQRDVNGMLWLAIGFFGGIFGIAAAYVIEPSPPASRLIGKSAEYVATYTDCYKSAGKDIQTKNAIKGCVISGLLYVAVYGCYYAIWAAAAASTAATH